MFNSVNGQPHALLCFYCGEPAEMGCVDQFCDEEDPFFCISCNGQSEASLHIHNGYGIIIFLNRYIRKVEMQEYKFEQKILFQEYGLNQIKYFEDQLQQQETTEIKYFEDQQQQQETTEIQLFIIQKRDEKELQIQGDGLDFKQDKMEISQKNSEDKQKINNNIQTRVSKEQNNKQEQEYKLSTTKQDKSTRKSERQQDFQQSSSYLKLFKQSIIHQKSLSNLMYSESIQQKDSQQKCKQEFQKSVPYSLQDNFYDLNSKDNFQQQEYQKFIEKYLSVISSQPLNKQFSKSMYDYNIILLPQQKSVLLQSQNRSITNLTIKVQENGTCVYQVLISLFKIAVFAKLIPLNLPKQFNQNKHLSSGTFGRCFRIKIKFKKQKKDQYLKQQEYFQHLYCMKCVDRELQLKFAQLQYCIIQFAIGKLASVLEIGPFVPNDRMIGFNEIHVFKNAITWNMQYCMDLEKYLQCRMRKFNQKYSNLNKQQRKLKFEQMKSKILRKFDSDISEALAKLHALKIVHRDIKFSNILWSPKFKKFVFCDFGLSHAVNQTYKEKSLVTEASGTKGYMYPQLQNLMNQKIANPKMNLKLQNQYVNYYYNDLFACQETFNRIIKKLDVLFMQSSTSSNIVSTLVIRKQVFQRNVLDFVELHKAWMGWTGKVKTSWQQKILMMYDQKQIQLEQKNVNEYQQFALKHTQISFKKIFVLERGRGQFMQSQESALNFIENNLQRFKRKIKQTKGNQNLFEFFQYLMRSKYKMVHIKLEEKYNQYKSWIIGQAVGENLFFFQYAQIIQSINEMSNQKDRQEISKQIQLFKQTYQSHRQFIPKFDQIFFIILVNCNTHQEDIWSEQLIKLRQQVEKYQDQDLLTVYTNAILEIMSYKDKNYHKLKNLMKRVGEIKYKQENKIELQLDQLQSIKGSQIILTYAKWYLLLVEKNIAQLVKTLNIKTIQLLNHGNILITELCLNCYFMFYLMGEKIIQDVFVFMNQKYLISQNYKQKNYNDIFFSKVLRLMIKGFNMHRKQIIINQIYQNIANGILLQEDVLLFAITDHMSQQQEIKQFQSNYFTQTKLFYSFRSAYYDVVKRGKRTPHLIDQALRFQYCCKLLFGGLSPLLGTKDLDFLQNIIKQQKVEMCQNGSVSNCMKFKPQFCQKTHSDYIFYNYNCKNLIFGGNQKSLDIVYNEAQLNILPFQQKQNVSFKFLRLIFPQQIIDFQIEDWKATHTWWITTQNA